MHKRHLWALSLAGILCALYLCQVVSPLRLNTDAIRFLSLARSAAEGHGYLVDGKPDLFPEGYPFVLMLLIKAGFGSTVWINSLNLGCVLAAAWMFRRILTMDPALSPASRTMLSVLPLASWVWSKHAIVPVSENLYLALSMAALLFLCRAQAAHGKRAICSYAIAFLLAFASFRARTVGISLVAAGFISACFHPDLRPVWTTLRLAVARRKGIIVATAMSLIAAGVWLASKRSAMEGGGSYLGMLRNAADRGASSFGLALLGHFGELGEVTLNLPATRFPALKFLFTFAGGIVCGVCLARYRDLARRFTPLAWYLAFYGGIIFLWPFSDPRFWMPVIPLLGLCLYLSARHWMLERKWMRRAICAYTAAFVALGILALVLQTRVSWSGAQFPMRFGDGTNQDTYRVAFGLARRDEVPAIDESLLRLLEDFEPLARRKIP